MGKKSRSDRHSEPALPEEGWFHYGGGDDALWVVNYTEGGAPYGPTRAEMREAHERGAAGAGWARAKAILRTAFTSRFPQASVEIGRVTRLGQGLSRDVFAAPVELSPDPGALSGPYAVLLPVRRVDDGFDERTKREARLLERLAKLSLPFRVPIVLGAWRDAGYLALVRSFLSGVELDLRAGRQARIRPWEVVGELAAAVHSLDVATFGDLLPGHDTRKVHAEEWLLGLEDVDATEAKAALGWARAHLPPDEASVLVHGDLLGQNVLLAPGHPPGLIDWEYARRGDPAYDLAIITRGVRRPFQIDGGMHRLLDAYTRFGGRAVAADHIHVYELGMAVAFYRDCLRSGRGEQPAEALARLRNMLRRLGG
jgi:aminoglycoside phosphotransferase (APT) family kinase protein